MAIYHDKHHHAPRGRVAALIIGTTSAGSFIRVMLVLFLASIISHLLH